MTKEQIQILNDSINNIMLVCKSCNTCIECPMNHNCNEQPAHWKPIKEVKDNYYENND